ncbi:glycosyltransferase [Diaminobutyricibacter sp. McL0608]|uniref:glycosyltransferase n=1 Tax=Leifsonia sp. McL0608 TaxID=3143537 RepID=UPI0031F32343
MRVLVVTTWFPSSSEPVQAPFNLEHVKAISRKHDVRVIHVVLGGTGDPVTETYEGVRVRRVPFRPTSPLSMFRAWSAIRGALRQADVLHTMAFSSVLVVAPVQVLSFAAPPWVHSEHWSGVTNPESVPGRWKSFAWLRHALRLPDRLTSVTSQLAEVLATFGRPGSVSVVPCVVENDRPIVQPSFGDPLELVAVAGLIEGKRPLMAVRTLEWLRAKGHDVRLTWIGGGVLAEETYDLAAELGVADSLVLAGRVAPRDVFARLEQADLFFLPTAQENFLTAAAESLSAGRGVVVPGHGGYLDYVDEANGVLVDGNSPEAYGSAILRAVEKFRGLDARRLADPIRSRFSRDAVGDAFDSLYTALCADRAGTAGAERRG